MEASGSQLRRNLCRFALAAVLWVVQGTATLAQDWIAQVDRSVVRVVVGNEFEPTGTGTGWVISNGGYIVTNHHVVDGSVRQVVIYRDETGNPKPLKATIVAKSAPNDLVLLRVSADLPPLSISSVIPAKGSDVFAIGFPAAADELDYNDSGGLIESTVTSGKIGRIVKGQLFGSNENQGYASTTWIQHSAAISGGNSGGPLFDACGRVIGINTAGALGKLHISTGSVEVPQGILFAAPVENVAGLLQQANISLTANDNQATCGSAGSVQRATPAAVEASAPDAQVPWTLILAGVAMMAAIGAIAISRRPPVIISETYTQFKRRSPDMAASQVPIDRAPERVSWVLKGKNSQGSAVIIQLRAGQTSTIGRDPAHCKYVIDDPTVSRQHLEIRLDSDGGHIRDLGSANGTSVDGRAIGRQLTSVSAGQHIRMGRVDLLVVKKTN